MNLDELKTSWNNDSLNDVTIPEALQHLKQAQHPMDKLKRNMKREWMWQLIAIALLAFVPQWQEFSKDLYPYYYIAYGYLVILSVYYLERFRKFYRQLLPYAADTKESLTVIYYEFKLNIGRYHSFGFLLLPFGLVWMFLYVHQNLSSKGKSLEALSGQTQILLLAAMISIALLLVGAIVAWTKYYYGPYLKQLKTIIEELKS